MWGMGRDEIIVCVGMGRDRIRVFGGMGRDMKGEGERDRIKGGGKETKTLEVFSKSINTINFLENTKLQSISCCLIIFEDFNLKF